MRWQSILSTGAIVVAAVLCIMVAGSCQIFGRHDPGTGPRKLGYGQLRTDKEPLIQRFPALEGALSVRWMSGLYGEQRNPGPSTYWIDAVVTLGAAQAEHLNHAYATDTTKKRPRVVYGMAEHVPKESFRVGEPLDGVFTQGSWLAKAYLAPRSHQLVLVATGT